MEPSAFPLRPLASSVPSRRRGGTTAMLAAFVSAETNRLGRELGFDVAVIDVIDEPADHARTLSRTWHGCWRPTDSEGWYLPFDFGDATASTARFDHLAFDERWLGAVALPPGMRLACGCIEVDLAPGVHRSDLRQAFVQAMADRKFDWVAMQPARVRQRFASGRRLTVSCRYAAPPVAGCNGAVSLVENIYAFRPRSFPNVVSALESSVRILSMCSALAGAATAETRRA